MHETVRRTFHTDDTIVAISTPLGHSGIGVVRISGTEAIQIARRFVQPAILDVEYQHRTAMGARWVDAQGELVDQVIVTVFRAPQSYTGEDVVEVSGHGNPFSLRRIVETARSVGARLAEPGEFTLRAVVHGKLDLTQAEAVRDFIDAQTQQQAKNALMQMAGSVSRKIRPTKQRLVDVIAQLEAGIDFAEDDIDVPANETLIGEIRQLQNGLENLANTFSFGTILSRGLRLTIVGKPNVGKSSLFNQLLCADRAIVTQIPGTTRDVLTETINLEGVPLSFADTAGVREAVDEVERIGVERTMETLSDSDFALVVLDGSTPLERDDQTVLESASQRPHVLVINKSDLPQRLEISALNGSRRLSISAKTGQGLEELREELRHFLLAKKSDLADDLVLTSVRQYEVVTRSAASLSAASKALAARVPHEMVLLDLYSALSSLGEMTGDVTTEDILDRIFSTFCVGK